MAKPFAPEFQAHEDQHNKAELIKRASNGMRGTLHEEFRGDEDDLSAEAESLAKSYGIYLEFNRAKTGKEKDWMFMIRLGVPGGGPISPEQWRVVDELAERHGRDPEGFGSLRLTTRAAIQFHWVKKSGVIDVIKTSAEAGLLSLNGCGDNVRNVVACPHSSHSDIFDGGKLAVKLADYFQLPATPFVQIFAVDPNAVEQERETFRYGPQLLNRKFKMAISGLYRDPETGEVKPDNCVEMRTHDLGILPLYEGGQVKRFQVYLGGGQGENNGKTTASLLSQPFAIVTEEQLMPVLDAIVAVHQEWGDRKNRHWARLKYVIKAQGVPWYRQEVENRVGFPLGHPLLGLDVGERHLHHGWSRQPSNGKFSFGAFIENGRLIDSSPNGKLKTMVREVALKYQTPIQLTPNQDIVFTNIQEEDKAAFEADLHSYGFGSRRGKPYSALRLHSGACVGRTTCRLAYTDSEEFEPELIDALEDLGWGSLSESIGITGCERQCFRPGVKAIGLVGSGMNRYQVKLFGDVDGRFQGRVLLEDGRIYLKSVPRDQVAPLLDTLFHYYFAHKDDVESLGAFFRRVGESQIISYLKSHPKTTDLMKKSMAGEAFPESLPKPVLTGAAV